MVDDADYGNLESDHGPNLRGETTRGVDHMLGDDGAILRDNVPGSARTLLDVSDAVAKVDFCPSLACARGQGVGAAGGIGVPVTWRIEPQDDVLRVQEGMEFLDLRRADDVGFRACGAKHSLGTVIPIHLVLVVSESDRPAIVKTRRLSGLRFQSLVKLRGIAMDLGHAQASYEMGNERRRMPGHARSELAFFNQHHVRPALFGQVIEERDPHNSSADNDDPCV